MAVRWRLTEVTEGHHSSALSPFIGTHINFLLAAVPIMHISLIMQNFLIIILNFSDHDLCHFDPKTGKITSANFAFTVIIVVTVFEKSWYIGCINMSAVPAHKCRELATVSVWVCCCIPVVIICHGVHCPVAGILYEALNSVTTAEAVHMMSSSEARRRRAAYSKCFTLSSIQDHYALYNQAAFYFICYFYHFVV